MTRRTTQPTFTAWFLGLSFMIFTPYVIAETPPAMPVKIQVIETTHVALNYEYPARVQSANQVEIHARVNGELLKQHVTDGQNVKADDLLYSIDARTYQVAVDKAQAQVLTAQAQLRQAEREKLRVEGLFKEKAVSAQERDQALSAYELAQAGLVGAEAALKEAQIYLDYTQVRAPINGITGQKQQTIGDLVGRDYNRSLLTTLTQLDPIEVHFTIGEREFIERQQQLQQGILRFSQGEQLSAQVTHLGNQLRGGIDFADHQINPHTGSVSLRARFANPNAALLPGAFVRIQLGGIEAVDVIQIPQSAALQIGSQAFVYVIKDGTAQMVPVGLQRAVGQTWLVDSGLAVGDQLILNNLIKLRPNTPVQAVQASHSTHSAE
ncbi:efflux RND transporter periplasmic adaptor subunit [Thiomicrospira microaerophila]|uniref:efflux RND transporter periplasmic adaptor subunit n=1 Tax=Thiomicrospira microaerophila TaxID=406020 RepID=UPI00200EB0D7|nr:efflux RND transporter periplasmic adaptor subunit [Thiomicrospira microaerophila]UQB42885.1 efflux RND transporter periplasmic adaptor subunit [Thiomicrospira microaerophila]